MHKETEYIKDLADPSKYNTGWAVENVAPCLTDRKQPFDTRNRSMTLIFYAIINL